MADNDLARKDIPTSSISKVYPIEAEIQRPQKKINYVKETPDSKGIYNKKTRLLDIEQSAKERRKTEEFIAKTSRTSLGRIVASSDPGIYSREFSKSAEKTLAARKRFIDTASPNANSGFRKMLANANIISGNVQSNFYMADKEGATGRAERAAKSSVRRDLSGPSQSDLLIGRLLEDQLSVSGTAGEVAANTNTVLGQIHKFNRTVNTAYMTKSLALMYQQTYVAKEQLGMLETIGVILDNKLEAIKINTGAPEIKKRSMADILREGILRNLANKTTDKIISGVNHYIRPYLSTKVVKPLKDYVKKKSEELGPESRSGKTASLLRRGTDALQRDFAKTRIEYRNYLKQERDSRAEHMRSLGFADEDIEDHDRASNKDVIKSISNLTLSQSSLHDQISQLVAAMTGRVIQEKDPDLPIRDDERSIGKVGTRSAKPEISSQIETDQRSDADRHLEEFLNEHADPSRTLSRLEGSVDLVETSPQKVSEKIIQGLSSLSPKQLNETSLRKVVDYISEKTGIDSEKLLKHHKLITDYITKKRGDDLSNIKPFDIIQDLGNQTKDILSDGYSRLPQSVQDSINDKYSSMKDTIVSRYDSVIPDKIAHMSKEELVDHIRTRLTEQADKLIPDHIAHMTQEELIEHTKKTARNLPENLTGFITQHTDKLIPDNIAHMSKEELVEHIKGKMSEKISDVKSRAESKLDEVIPDEMTYMSYKDILGHIGSKATEKISQKATEVQSSKHFPKEKYDKLVSSIDSLIPNDIAHMTKDELIDHLKDKTRNMPETIRKAFEKRLDRLIPDDISYMTRDELIEHTKKKATEGYSHIRGKIIGPEGILENHPFQRKRESQDEFSSSKTTTILEEIVTLIKDWREESKQKSEISLEALNTIINSRGLHGAVHLEEPPADAKKEGFVDGLKRRVKSGFGLDKLVTGGLRLGGKTIGKAVGAFGDLAKWEYRTLNKIVKYPFRSLDRSPYTDVYRKDNIVPGKPLLTKKKLEAGVVFGNKSKVLDVADITEPVLEPESGEILITEDDIKIGLVDIYGKDITKRKRVRSIAGMTGDLAMGSIRSFFGLGKSFFSEKNPLFKMYASIFSSIAGVAGSFAGLLTKGLSGAFGAGLGLGKAAGGMVKSLFGIYGKAFGFSLDMIKGVGSFIGDRVFGFGKKGMIKRKDLEEVVGDKLDNIYKLLEERLPRPIKDDLDQDGDEDGSYTDYINQEEERKEKKEKSRSKLMERLRERFNKDKEKKDDDSSDSSGGMFGNLLTMLGIGAGTGAGGVTAASVLKRLFGLGGAAASGAGATAGAVGTGAVGATGAGVAATGAAVGAEAALGGTAAAGAAGATAAGAAKTGLLKKVSTVLLKDIGKVILKKIPIIGLAVGSGLAINRLLDGDITGASGEFLSGIFSIVPGFGTAASLVVDSWLGLRDYRKRDVYNENAKIRMTAYGIDDVELYPLIENFEEQVDKVFLGERPKFDKTQYARMAKKLGFDPNDEQQVDYFITWFVQRFGRILLTYRGILKDANYSYKDRNSIPQTDLEKINKRLSSQISGFVSRYSKFKPTPASYYEFIKAKDKPPAEASRKVEKPLESTEDKSKIPGSTRSPEQKEDLPHTSASHTSGTTVQTSASYRPTDVRTSTPNDPEQKSPSLYTARPTDIPGSTSASYMAGDGSQQALGDTGDDTLGKLSAEFESKTSGGSSAVGYDTTGGTSYGKYQIASKPGTFGKFIEFLKSKGPEGVAAAKELTEGPANTGSTRGIVPSNWKELAYANIITKYEHEFIKETHYDEAFRRLPSEIKRFISKNQGLKEVLWATATAMGPFGAISIFKQAYDPNGTVDDFITKVYAIRATKYSSSKPNIQAAMRKRSVDEGALARSMIGEDINKKVSELLGRPDRSPEVATDKVVDYTTPVTQGDGATSAAGGSGSDTVNTPSVDSSSGLKTRSPSSGMTSGMSSPNPSSLGGSSTSTVYQSATTQASTGSTVQQPTVPYTGPSKSSQEYKSIADIPPGVWRWRNITPKDIACRDGTIMINPEALDKLDMLFARMGKKLRINSGYRSPSYNSTLKGAAKDSNHTRGMAFDISVRDGTDPALLEATAKAVGFRGLGYYEKDQFIHVDTGASREWGRKWFKSTGKPADAKTATTSPAVATPPPQGGSSTLAGGAGSDTLGISPSTVDYAGSVTDNQAAIDEHNAFSKITPENSASSVIDLTDPKQASKAQESSITPPVTSATPTPLTSTTQQPLSTSPIKSPPAAAFDPKQLEALTKINTQLDCVIRALSPLGSLSTELKSAIETLATATSASISNVVKQQNVNINGGSPSNTAFSVQSKEPDHYAVS